MPRSVTGLGNGVFAECSRLASVFFEGHVPEVGSAVFSNANQATIYYLPGMAGWGPTFAGRPTVLWTVGPIIRANLSRDDITIAIGENLSVLVQIIDSGQYAGTEVDWWIVALAGSDWYYLNSFRQWTAFDGNPLNCQPVYQGALGELPITEILNLRVPGGSYAFWFAVNYPMDSVLDARKPMLIDAVRVAVR